MPTMLVMTLMLYLSRLQTRLAEEATRLAAEKAAAAAAVQRAAATLRAVEEDIDEETENLKAGCVHPTAAQCI